MGQAEPTGQTLHVGVDRKPGKVERHAAQDVGCLAPHSGERHQVFHAPRHDAIEPVANCARHADEAARLCSEEPSGADQLFDFADWRIGERIDIGEAGEQRRCRAVHSFVGALGRQDRGGQQLKRIRMVEGAQIGRRPREALAEPQVGLARPASWCARSDHGRRLPVGSAPWTIPPSRS